MRHLSRRRSERVLTLVATLVVLAPAWLHATPPHAVFRNANSYVKIAVLRDDVLHIEAATGTTSEQGALYASPMVLKRDYAGPASYVRQGNTLNTRLLRVDVDSDSLCLTLYDKTRRTILTTLCPRHLSHEQKSLTLTKGGMTHAYGLGQQFRQLGSADGDWVRFGTRDSGLFGNELVGFGQGGMVGNIQIPVLFALGAKTAAYALLLDDVHKQTWSLGDDPWRVTVDGGVLRLYFLAGPNLSAVRKSYMELTGTPPVPPRKAFGLWVSEYGYKNWAQIDTLATGLRRDGFPVDGFVLDLYWFGGVKAGSPNSAMGRLNWDISAFPDAKDNVARLAADDLGLMAIEEPYLSKNTDTYEAMAKNKLLAYTPNEGVCDDRKYQPLLLDEWFGVAGMVDWSNPQAGVWLHDQRRVPNLIQLGVIGHWTDLGEPEKLNGGACYRGVETTATGMKNRHVDIHNLYAFLWNQSIYDGYYRQRAVNHRRPFILSRSGAAGSQRFGVAMWSGDIGSNLDILATHLNAQLHMSLAGVDYYGADVGGFRREAMPCNQGHNGQLQYQDELYTQWLANAAWFDVPLRPHTDNSQQTTERYATAPNLVGSIDANRQSIRQRYELLPYYYSLAYRAYLYGEPVVPPLVHYYQDDDAVLAIGDEKLIGRDLLVAAVSKHGDYTRNIYLPDGKWIDYHTNEWSPGKGWLVDYPIYLNGMLTLPVFVRAGAIIPQMYVDEKTKDAFGQRQDSVKHDELMVRVFPKNGTTTFTLYEDDGTTLRYNSHGRPEYDVRTTEISQTTRGTLVTVTIEAARGSYANAVTKRNNLVSLTLENAEATRVKLNGAELPQVQSQEAFKDLDQGWRHTGKNSVVAKSGVLALDTKKVISVSTRGTAETTSAYLVCDNAWTSPGEEIYAVGNVAKLGHGDPRLSLKLSPSVRYPYIDTASRCGPGPRAPTWTALVTDLPGGATLTWKCVKRTASGEWQWQGGTGNVLLTAKRGFSGTSRGRL